jgi:serine/threonine protein phosphatase 1
MQTLVIGDIHGCYFELQALLDKAGLSDGDSIISLGDFVDRGPETPQVLDFFRYTPNARALMGNHERKHVRAARGEVKLAISQHISRQQFGDGYQDAVIWMGSLPLFLELPDAVLVHGYLEPGLPLVEQNPSVVCGTMGGDKILRERYERSWYEYEHGDKPVIVGHYNYTDSDQPFIYQDRIFGLDTDCVHGKTLTGLLLPSFRILSVSSRGNLWRQVRRTYNKPVSPPKPVIPWTAQDELLLDKLVEQAKFANEILLASLQQEPDFSELTLRQQGKRYTENTGTGIFASLMQLARLDRLDSESARKIIKEPGIARKLLDNGK